MNYTIIDENTKNTDVYCDYIYINNNSLSKPLCDEIIQLYNLDEKKYEGITMGGVDKNIKDTMDLIITNDNKWIKIKRAIHKELIENLNNYIEKLNNKSDYLNIDQQTNSKFKYFSNSSVTEIYTFMIQKYNKYNGKYIYHNDARIDLDKKQSRIITFLWYLNDVVEGGETVFSGKYAVKPSTGKLVLFPATWSYPHCGKIPLSSDKFILTGWVYANI